MIFLRKIRKAIYIFEWNPVMVEESSLSNLINMYSYQDFMKFNHMKTI